jgi:hypothetical protein
MTGIVRIWVPAGECFSTRLCQLSLVVFFLLALSACSDGSNHVPVANDPVDVVDQPKVPVFDDPAPANVSDPLPADEDALLLAFENVLHTMERELEWLKAHPHYTDDQARAEAVRMLIEFSAGGLNGALTNNDFPHIVLPDPRQWSQGVPNPNSQYQAASIDGTSDFRLWCSRGTTSDVIVQVVGGGNIGAGGGGDSLTSNDLHIDPDGNFTVFLGPERPETCSMEDCNWLNSTGQFVTFIRYTHSDWEAERPGRCHIEKRGNAGELEPALTTGTLAQKLAITAGAISQLRLWTGFAETLKSRLPANFVFVPRQHEGIEGKYHSQGWFDLDEGQALIIERLPPGIEAGSKALFSGIDLANFWWQGLDPANHQSSLTTDQAYTWPGDDSVEGTEDDRIRYVISKTDPGVKNWVDTVGRDSGWITLRWQGADPSMMPPNSTATTPKTQLVAIEDLPTILGADEFISGPEERKAQITIRQANIRERYSGWSSAVGVD